MLPCSPECELQCPPPPISLEPVPQSLFHLLWAATTSAAPNCRQVPDAWRFSRLPLYYSVATCFGAAWGGEAAKLSTREQSGGGVRSGPAALDGARSPRLLLRRMPARSRAAPSSSHCPELSVIPAAKPDACSSTAPPVLPAPLAWHGLAMKTFTRRGRSGIVASSEQPSDPYLDPSSEFFFPGALQVEEAAQQAPNRFPSPARAPARSPLSKGGSGGGAAAGGVKPPAARKSGGAAAKPAAPAPKAKQQQQQQQPAAKQQQAPKGSKATAKPTSAAGGRGSGQAAVPKPRPAAKPAASLLSGRPSGSSVRQQKPAAQESQPQRQQTAAVAKGRPSVRSKPAAAPPAEVWAPPPAEQQPAAGRASPSKRKAAKQQPASGRASPSKRKAAEQQPASGRASPSKRKAAAAAAPAAVGKEAAGKEDASPSKKMKRAPSSGTAAAAAANGGSSSEAAAVGAGAAAAPGGARPTLPATLGSLQLLTRLVHPEALREQAAATTVIQAQALGEQQSITCARRGWRKAGGRAGRAAFRPAGLLLAQASSPPL